MYYQKVNTMKRISVILTTALLAFIGLPDAVMAQNSIYDQLVKLNAEWVHVTPDWELLQTRNFESEQELITYHLKAVESKLRDKDRSHLSAATQELRNEGLDVLNQYWQRELYPKNYSYDHRIPFFIDDANTACAVGYIIQGTGNEALLKIFPIARTMPTYVKWLVKLYWIGRQTMVLRKKNWHGSNLVMDHVGMANHTLLLKSLIRLVETVMVRLS